MTRRRSGPNFGSDSFLDIVANLVGILLIFIVVVGVRIEDVHRSHAEATAEQLAAAVADAERSLEERSERQRQLDAAAERTAEEDRRRLDERQTLNAERSAANAAAERVHHERLDRRERQRRADEAALLERRRRNAERQRTLAAERDRREAVLRDADSTRQRLSARLEERRETLRRLTDSASSAEQADSVRATERLAAVAERDRLGEAVATMTTTLAATETQVESTRERIAGVAEQVSQVKDRPPVVSEWRHEATPLSRTADRTELHLRIMGDRVAYTHFGELVGELAGVLRGGRPRLNGTLGPRGGFVMQYRFRPGFAGGGPQLEGLELQGSPRLGELVEDALDRGDSDLWGTLRRRSPADYAVTLWVYPESFAAARLVQQRLHERGWAVATRPLPAGVNISASPSGTVSRLQ